MPSISRRRKTPQSDRKTNVDLWLEKVTPHQRKALENASRHFDKNDLLTVNTLEAMYGQESSFGVNMGKRGENGPAEHFQFEKKSAQRFGLKVTKSNDQRFDIDNASNAIAEYLKDLDGLFTKETKVISNIVTIPVSETDERKKFAVASINAGEGRIARAQQAAKKAGENPSKWEIVKKYLEQAGATQNKAIEITDYVNKVFQHEKEFSKKSLADKNLKDLSPRKEKSSQSEKGHWITKERKRIFIEDK